MWYCMFPNDVKLLTENCPGNHQYLVPKKRCVLCGEQTKRFLRFCNHMKGKKKRLNGNQLPFCHLKHLKTWWKLGEVQPDEISKTWWTPGENVVKVRNLVEHGNNDNVERNVLLFWVWMKKRKNVYCNLDPKWFGQIVSLSSVPKR